MHVLIVSLWYKSELGGVAETVINLVEGLTARGVKVSILLSGNSYRLIQTATDGEVPIYSIIMRPVEFGNNPIMTHLGNLYYFLPTCFRLGKFLIKEKIDVINIHFPISQHIYFLLLKWILRKKLVASVHGSDVRKFMHRDRLTFEVVGLMLRCADTLVACSHKLLSETLALIRRPEKKNAQVIHGGVKSHWLEPRTAQDEMKNEEYILAVGGLWEVKGFDILINSVSLMKGHLEKLKIVIVGGGPLQDELQNLIKKLNLNKQILLKGPVARDLMKDIFAKALFCVVASRNEGFPLATLEAQAMGKAVIASNVGGLPEIIEDGVNGLLFPVGDAVQLSEKMTYLLEHPEVSRTMGKAGRELVRNNFTWDHTSQNYLNLYHRLLA